MRIINYVDRILLILKIFIFLLFNHDKAYANIILKITVLIHQEKSGVRFSHHALSI